MDRNAQALGRAREFRCYAESADAIYEPEVAQVLCGRGGMWLRLGAHPRKAIVVGWSDIRKLERGKLWADVLKPEQ